MRSRVRFPVLPWGFFLEVEDHHGDHGLGSLVELRFKAPLDTSCSCYHPPHWDNLTMPHGRPNLRKKTIRVIRKRVKGLMFVLEVFCVYITKQL
jgi:hypothetical protein